MNAKNSIIRFYFDYDDDFPYLELFLAGKDPLAAVDWQKWNRPVRASSMRRRFRTTEGG